MSVILIGLRRRWSNLRFALGHGLIFLVKQDGSDFFICCELRMSTEGTKQEDVGEIAFSRGPSASIEWKIHDYFEFPQEVNCYFDSPTFSFLDSTWILRLYPNGQSDHQSTGWISLYLTKKNSSSQTHHLQFSLGIMGFDDSNYKNHRMEHTFERTGKTYGWHNYIKAEKLREISKDIVPNGVLTVVCNLNANEGVHAAVQTETTPSVEKLAHDFKDLLLSEEESDMTLKVKDRDYKVHRAVLVARSTVFSAMMKSNMKEKSSGVVQIDDCDPEAFQQFLTYLYSGDWGNFSADSVFALHSIADKYDAQELKKPCVQFIADNLSVATFCDVLSLSLKYNESELLEKAVEFFAKNLMNILVSTKWLSFVKENPVEANELHIKSAKYYAKLD